MTDTTGSTDLTGTPGTAPGDPTGALDEALERLHAAGPERNGWLSNHGPMAVEALVRHGQAPAVHRWLDHYSHKLEDMPTPAARVTAENWHEALGDPRRIADWTTYFERETAGRPWQDVLAEWWPRLLPGIAAGATHPVIRVGHAVRTLLDGEANAPGQPSSRTASATGPPATSRCPRCTHRPRSFPRRVPRPRWTPYRRWPTRVAGYATGWRSSPSSRCGRSSSRTTRTWRATGWRSWSGPRPTATPPTATAHRSCWCTPRPHPTPCCVRCPPSP